MTEDQNRSGHSIWCSACHGDGAIPDPKLGVIGGIPQTVVVEHTCQWCAGTGRRKFQPPV